MAGVVLVIGGDNLSLLFPFCFFFSDPFCSVWLLLFEEGGYGCFDLVDGDVMRV
jgi:hypothetical protein